jgi:hypothetical protein
VAARASASTQFSKKSGTFRLRFRRNNRAGPPGVSEASFLTQTDAGFPAFEIP